MPAGNAIYFWSACLLMGLAAAALAQACRDRFLVGLDWVERDLEDKLRRLRAPTRRLHRHMLLWLTAMVGVFLGFWLVWNNLIFAMLFAVLLATLPWWLVRRMAERRRQKIEDQMADAMVTLVSAVKAGLSLAQSLEILATQCPQPINAEFKQITGEHQMGKTLDQVLNEAKVRLRSENFSLFAAAVLAAHESGGRLHETVERIAQSTLEMQRLERKVQSETAQARKSAIYMALAPAVILVLYWFVDPENTARLFTYPPGQMILGVAVTLNVLAYLWARVILNPDI